MKLKTIISPLAILLLPLALACSDSNDLGVTCTLLQSGSDGPVPITEADVKEQFTGAEIGDKGAAVFEEILAMGVAECEDLACVRSAQFDPGPSATDSTPAQGYCVVRCSNKGSACKASDSKTKYVCRELLLDTETLSQICKNDPSSPYCGIESTLFCAQE